MTESAKKTGTAFQARLHRVSRASRGFFSRVFRAKRAVYSVFYRVWAASSSPLFRQSAPRKSPALFDAKLGSVFFSLTVRILMDIVYKEGGCSGVHALCFKSSNIFVVPLCQLCCLQVAYWWQWCADLLCSASLLQASGNGECLCDGQYDDPWQQKSRFRGVSGLGFRV